MRKLSKTVVGLVVCLPLLAQAQAGGRQAAPPRAPRTGAAATKATLDDIGKTLGFVPGYLRLVPDEALPGAWEAMKGLELNSATAIPNKYKELIGVAVAAQVPCDYCSYFHNQAAKAFGASNRELKEALGMAAITRQWSTILNGAQQEPGEFAAEVDRLFGAEAVGGAGEEGAEADQPSPQPTPLRELTPDETLADVRSTFGFVPTFISKAPEAALPGMWSEWKAVGLDRDTAIPLKYKTLISLSVASQIPCEYCVTFDKRAAMQAGASEEEIAEAIGMAALTRHWSTLLNGSLYDERQFRRDTDRVLRAVRRQMGVGGGGE